MPINYSELTEVERVSKVSFSLKSHTKPFLEITGISAFVRIRNVIGSTILIP